MADQPPRAQIGDEEYRQFQTDVAALRDLIPGNLTLSEGLAQYRQLVDEAKTKDQAAKDYVAGQGQDYINAVSNMANRAPGEAPSGRWKAAYNMTVGQNELIGSTEKYKISALDALTSFINAAKQQKIDDDKFQLEKDKFELDKKQFAIDNGYDPITGEPTTTLPDGTVLTEEQAKKAQLKGQAAVLEVQSQGGDFLLQKVNKSDQAKLAEEILRKGGVQNYRQDAQLISLLTEKELTASNSQASLEADVTRALGSMEALGEGFGGTGPLAQFIPGFMRSPEARDAIAQAESVTAGKIKEISGATVSDAEARRLGSFLPNKAKTETQNIEDLKRLQRGLQINGELFELAKRNGLTLDEALDKFGEEVFQKYGEVWPYGDQNQKSSSSGYTIEEVK